MATRAYANMGDYYKGLEEVDSTMPKQPERIPMPPVRPVTPASTAQPANAFTSFIERLKSAKMPKPRASKAPRIVAEQPKQPTTSFGNLQKEAIQRAILAHFAEQ